MKKTIFGLFVAFLAVQACKKSADTAATETAVDASTLSAKVTEYIANNYPDAAITSVYELSAGATRHIVGLDNSVELAFDRGGNCTGDGSDDHPDGHGHHGGPGQDSTGHHGHHGPDPGGHQHGDGDHHHGSEIGIDSLPKAITDYIAANYAGYTPKHAENDSLCAFGPVVEVALFKDSTDRVKLYFDAAGNFLASGARVDYATDVPQAVKDLATGSYAGYTPRSKAVKLTLADGSVQYIVFLKGSGGPKKIFVKEDGTLVCEQ